MSPVVEQPALARLITDAPDHRTFSVTLRYDADDPLAMRIVFPAEAGLDRNEAVWVFARDLLDEGLRLPSGEGDVQVWPCGRAQTVLELHSPQGVAMVQFDSAPLRRFLRNCYTMVPPGGERPGVEAERGIVL